MSAPEEFVAFLRGEIAKWTKVVKEANIRID
jgi:tripartite-type tricarboxylate transporter receptor subunit TctC